MDENRKPSGLGGAAEPTATEPETSNGAASRRGFLTAGVVGSIAVALGTTSEAVAQGLCADAVHGLQGPDELVTLAPTLFGRSRSGQDLDGYLVSEGFTQFMEGAFGICGKSTMSQPIVIIPYARLDVGPPADAAIVILPPAFATNAASLPSAGVITTYDDNDPQIRAIELTLLEVPQDGVVRPTSLPADDVREKRTDDLTRELFGKDAFLDVDRTLTSVSSFGTMSLAQMEMDGQDTQRVLQDYSQDLDYWQRSADLLLISDIMQPPMAIACCSCCCSCSWGHKDLAPAE